MWAIVCAQMEPSPAPKVPPKKRRWWLWGLAAVALLCTVSVAVLATYPRWAGPWAKRKLIEGLSQRLDTPVQIDALDLGYERVTLRGLTLEAPAIRIDEVEVTLASNPLWSWRVEADAMQIAGGYVEGEFDVVMALAKRVRDSVADASSDEASQRGWLRRRVKLRPRTMGVEGLAVDVRKATGPVSRAIGVLHAAVDPETLSVDGSIEQAQIYVRALGDKKFSAKRLSSKLRMGSGGPELPLRVDVAGGATAVTKQVAIAQVDGWVEVADLGFERVKLDLSGSFGAGTERAAAPGAKLWSVSGEGRRDLSEGSVTVAMEAFELGRVPEVLERVPGLVDSEKATAAGALSIDLADGKASLNGSVDLEGLNVRHPLLARDTLEDLDMRLTLTAKVDPAAYRVDLEKLGIERRDARVEVTGTLVHPPEKEARQYTVDLVVPKTPCGAVLNAIPSAFAPSLQGLVVEGSYEAKIHLDVDFSNLDELDLSTQLRPRGCRVKSVPPALSTARLRNGFTHRVTMRDGRQRMVRLFNGSGSYAALANISPNMVAAVLTTEDASFWRHSGFLPKQFGAALKRNLKAGRVRLGASTVTMQMVKNVFLSHERTLSRKFQELVLTEYVERTLSKNRIMELYLNVIEFAPGVYGVRRAAEHYFGKHPRELTSLEAAYLALMLPSPVRRHAHFCRGELTERFDRKLRYIHGLMFSRGHISEDEYLLWKDAPLTFDPLRSVSQGACLAEIEQLLEANEGQRAVTGLLRGQGADPDELDAVREQILDEAQEEDPDEPGAVPLPDVDEEFFDDPALGEVPRIPAMEQL